jgi:hypothetical protein
MMNERLQEFAREAGFYANPDVEKFEKFAELIVEECINIADKSNTGSKSSNEGTEFYYNADIGDKIKEHFGLDGMSTEDKKTLIKELLGVKNV